MTDELHAEKIPLNDMDLHLLSASACNDDSPLGGPALHATGPIILLNLDLLPEPLRLLQRVILVSEFLESLLESDLSRLPRDRPVFPHTGEAIWKPPSVVRIAHPRIDVTEILRQRVSFPHPREAVVFLLFDSNLHRGRKCGLQYPGRVWTLASAGGMHFRVVIHGA